MVRRNTDNKFVLWINYLPPASSPLSAYPKAVYLVAEAASPQGPFKVVTPKVAVQTSGAGDFDIFVDERGDGKGYIAYDACELLRGLANASRAYPSIYNELTPLLFNIVGGNNHRIAVEQLNDNLTDSLGANSTSGAISPSGNEAPILFERKGTYYLLYGPTCCL